MQEAKLVLVAMPFVAELLGVLAGCAGDRAGEPAGGPATPPAVRTEALSVGESTVLGVKLLQHDGRALGYMFRAERGIVACPHFDIETLANAGIPAATAKNWSEHDFRGELNERVLKVNSPAAGLGVKPGMTVEEALKLMSGRGK